MDSPSDMPEGAGKYIWLRYKTQFTVGERTHTIEMGIPMPLGASAETRELLLCEAEAGMDQLAYHIEQRVDQMLENTRARRPMPPPPSPPPKPTNNKPTSTTTPRTSILPPQREPVQVRERVSEQPTPQRDEIPMVPPTRPNLEMLPTTNIISDTNRNLLLREFLQYIKANLGLDSKQAMSLLKVKTLSGINLREALERLQQLVGQEALSTTPNTEPNQRIREFSSGVTMMPSLQPASQTISDNAIEIPTPLSFLETQPMPSLRTSDNEFEQENGASRLEKTPIVIYDEEEGLDEEEELEDLEQIRDLTQQERAKAKTLLSRLRETRGATTANAGRLQVLNNVAGTQVSAEQLQELVAGVWGVTILKKLKIDQVETLISWAKEDDFINEVEAVLLLLEEERYARGNR